MNGDVVVSSRIDAVLVRRRLARLFLLADGELVRNLTTFDAEPRADWTLRTGVFSRSCVVFFTKVEWTVGMSFDLLGLEFASRDSSKWVNNKGSESTF